MMNANFTNKQSSVPLSNPNVLDEIVGEEPSELARFREEWRAEVEKKKRATTSQQPTSPIAQEGSSAPPANFLRSSLKARISSGKGKAAIRAAEAAEASTTAATRAAGAPSISPQLSNALQIYRRAIRHEQNSELNEALVLYRQAFRTDPNVDKAYEREETIAAVLSSQNAKRPTTSQPAPTGASASAEGLARNMKSLSLVAGGTVRASLADILSGFPFEGLKFDVEDEKRPLAIAMLPDEVLVMILSMLDPTAVERFGSVCRKARVMTLDPTIWRGLVKATYRPPQIETLDDLPALIIRYKLDYRFLFIEQPRVRLDGVYIAVCHYIRPGLSENHWVNVSHLVTYHRYLRFLPNGTVISLLANEELGPQQVISMLKPTLRMKGCFIGTWTLDGATVQVSNLIEANGRTPLPELLTAEDILTLITIAAAANNNPLSASNPTTMAIPTVTTPAPAPSLSSSSSAIRASASSLRYVFTMSLNLKSKPAGRWNRLDIENYDTVNIETGDVIPVGLKHERPFWFSKVRSYGVY